MTYKNHTASELRGKLLTALDNGDSDAVAAISAEVKARAESEGVDFSKIEISDATLALYGKRVLDYVNRRRKP